MRRCLLVANWKMYKRSLEAKRYVQKLWPQIHDAENVDVVLAPPFTALSTVAEAIQGTRIGLAGQNVHWETQGAFTGEISPLMLTDLGCRSVIIGHSERRHLFREDDSAVNKKVKAAVRHGLTVILCLGETREQRDARDTLSVLHHQLETGLAGLGGTQSQQLVLAYEPVWAIGSGTPATPAQTAEVHAALRQSLAKFFAQDTADSIRILYGGSITTENIEDLLSVPHVDGGLVGGACLDPMNFASIVRSASTRNS